MHTPFHIPMHIRRPQVTTANGNPASSPSASTSTDSDSERDRPELPPGDRLVCCGTGGGAVAGTGLRGAGLGTRAAVICAKDREKNAVGGRQNPDSFPPPHVPPNLNKIQFFLNFFVLLFLSVFCAAGDVSTKISDDLCR